jgi:hypothetical protein
MAIKHNEIDFVKVIKAFKNDNEYKTERSIFYKKTNNGMVKMSTNGYILIVDQEVLTNHEIGQPVQEQGYYTIDDKPLDDNYFSARVDKLILENDLNYRQGRYVLIAHAEKDKGRVNNDSIKMMIKTMAKTFTLIKNFNDCELIIKPEYLVIKF